MRLHLPDGYDWVGILPGLQQSLYIWRELFLHHNLYPVIPAWVNCLSILPEHEWCVNGLRSLLPVVESRQPTVERTMNEEYIKGLLDKLQSGQLNIDQALDQLRHLPVEALDSARLDHHRLLRTGLPEAVFGQNKDLNQLVEILEALLNSKTVVLATRVSSEKAEKACCMLKGLTYHRAAKILTGNEQHIPKNRARGTVVLVTAGTSDFPVAEEARISLEWFGHPVQTIYDAGVAGIHRILAHSRLLQQATVIIVVAGMEGALPSVVAGMTGAPVIAVPTSVGYGSGAGGYAALLGMLNSCSPGLSVVNIDNGFGAACMAAAINRKVESNA